MQVRSEQSEEAGFMAREVVVWDDELGTKNRGLFWDDEFEFGSEFCEKVDIWKKSVMKFKFDKTVEKKMKKTHNLLNNPIIPSHHYSH
jgi:hypothetical protein